MSLLLLLASLNSVAFIFYGSNCLYSEEMVAEFKRFGLTRTQRLLTGVLQILGAIGAFMGLFVPIMGLLATAGLSLLMLLGFGVRLKIKDSVSASAPSFIFMLLNAYLFYSFWMVL